MEIVSRRAGVLCNHTFPVIKSDGLFARYVCDCIVNHHSPDLPTATILPHLHDVSDTWLFFDGGCEYDAIAWYHQFVLEQEVRWLFGSQSGSLSAQYMVMPQGFKAATRIAQQTLNVITARAYAEVRIACSSAHFNYIDNHCRMNRKDDDAALKHAFATTIKLVDADFGVLQDWSPTVSFIGSIMSIDDKGHNVALKATWATRASTYLSAVASAARAPMHTVAGVAVWAYRVLRLPLAHLYDTLHAVRQNNDGPSPATRVELRECVRNITIPRTLTPVPSHIIPIAIDATPHRVAAVRWEPVPFVTPSTFPQHTIPFAEAANRACAAIPTTTPSPAHVYAEDIPRTRINLAELLAFLLIVHHAPPGTLLAVLSDSKVALRWMRHGIAPTRAACNILIAITRLAYAKRIRIVLAWIAGDINPSDTFTCSGRTSGNRHTGAALIVYQRTTERGFRVTTWL